jgi:hypothetical protein
MPALPDFMGLLGKLTTVQLVLGFLACCVALWILKMIMTPGGARKRMKGMAAVWIMIPFLVGIGGVIVYFVIKILAKAPNVVT